MKLRWCPELNRKLQKKICAATFRKKMRSHCLSPDHEVYSRDIESLETPQGGILASGSTVSADAFSRFDRTAMAALVYKESLSCTSPVTVAGPLRICTVFLGP